MIAFNLINQMIFQNSVIFAGYTQSGGQSLTQNCSVLSGTVTINDSTLISTDTVATFQSSSFNGNLIINISSTTQSLGVLSIGSDVQGNVTITNSAVSPPPQPASIELEEVGGNVTVTSSQSMSLQFEAVIAGNVNLTSSNGALSVLLQSVNGSITRTTSGGGTMVLTYAGTVGSVPTGSTATEIINPDLYNPSVPGNWTTVPRTVQQALDLIAASLGPV